MIYEFEGLAPKIDPSAFISETACIIGDVTIGADCYVGPGAVIRADKRGCPVVIGDESIVEDNVVIHVGGRSSDGCHIGNNVTIGHGAIVHGDRLEDHANVGMGAIVSVQAVIGEYAVVAEGAVVKRGQVIPPKVVVGGAPAKVLRELEDRDIETWDKSNLFYVELARKCKDPAILKRLD